jgi:hypothetical protein
MTVIQGRSYDPLLSDTTERLIWELHRDLTAREIIGAVVRARIVVREGYADTLLDPPPPDKYVALVIGLAKKELAMKVPALDDTAIAAVRRPASAPMQPFQSV